MEDLTNDKFIVNATYYNKNVIIQTLNNYNLYGEYDHIDDYPFILNLLYSILTTFNHLNICPYVPINACKYSYEIKTVDSNVCITLVFSDRKIVTVKIHAHDNYYIEYLKTIKIFKETVIISNWKFMYGITHGTNNEVKYESISGASPNKL